MMLTPLNKSADAEENGAQQRFKKACKGDQDAFWALIEPYSGLIYSVAFGIMKDHEASQDMLHEVFVKAYHSLNNLQNPKRMSSWLYALTRNACYDILRKNVRAEKGRSEVISRGPTIVPVSEILIKEEELVQLQKSLESLPEPFRIILGMKYMNKLSYQEISDALEITVGAVKSRLFEARKLLSAKMTEIEHSDMKNVNGGINK